jgi:CRISPR/Cas system CMR-associated protein Cmr5 small subunit
MKKNLEQIRAKNALGVARGMDKKCVNKVPARIMCNGLLAAASFALDKAGEDLAVFEKAILPHLMSMEKIQQTQLRKFIEELAEKDSANLREITTESLAYLNYLRRYAVKSSKKES